MHKSKTEEIQIKSLTSEDRKLLSDLSSTFDLGTQTIIGQDEEDMVNHARQSSIEEERRTVLKEEVIQILYKKFGNRDDIYECADEWSRKQVLSNGVVAYYKAYYNK